MNNKSENYFYDHFIYNENITISTVYQYPISFTILYKKKLVYRSLLRIILLFNIEER